MNSETIIKNNTIQQVAVIGCGVMGSQLLLYLAAHGLNLTCIIKGENNTDYHNRIELLKQDPFWNRFLRDKELKPIKFTNDYKDISGSDLVIECVTENINIKQQVFNHIEKHVASSTIISTTTSSYKISTLSEGMKASNRLVGLHFFNPILGMKLVELIVNREFDKDSLFKVEDFLNGINKTYVIVKDINGFLINRLLLPYLVESVNQYFDSGMHPEKFDEIVKMGTNYKMGPLELIDTIGIDVFSAISEIIYDSTQDEKFKAPKEIQHYLNENKLGKKTKEGFLKYN
ncbi:3-hydroxyacyl-CoA dehydrogenase family protein [Weeksellaceae bacterium KMM 9713]|uniref:3-hydroxyacyl-CoA dehydrogenase family protein n=1 Tax=Profundicola chukchiensis TaxID=2961959 RepID=A0A9X4RUZ5_9FLAO|nr:3-hydroxyacyl-CoA dehydrogenase family protein [Profundicola chukchiensis]MDG4946648.1 3-hydroxyacyl-CoA dehydrogenase family protein [Profundicola chukchiensis]